MAVLVLIGLGICLYKRKTRKQLAMAAVVKTSESATVVHESFPQSSKTGDASSMVTEISDLEKKEQPVVHQPPTAAAAELITWLNESCGFSDDEVTLYTEAFMELGIDKPEHLQMIDGEEVAWPAIVKPVHRKRIQASLEPGTSMASPRSREGSLVSDRL